MALPAGDVYPALYPGEQPLDSGAIEMHSIIDAVNVAVFDQSLPLVVLVFQTWYEILSARKNKRVRFLCIPVLW